MDDQIRRSRTESASGQQPGTERYQDRLMWGGTLLVLGRPLVEGDGGGLDWTWKFFWIAVLFGPLLLGVESSRTRLGVRGYVAARILVVLLLGWSLWLVLGAPPWLVLLVSGVALVSFFQDREKVR
jgi:hypothetical protein